MFLYTKFHCFYGFICCTFFTKLFVIIARVALYILYSGHLEAYHSTQSSLVQAVNLLPGATLHLPEILLEQDNPQTLVTLDECEIWMVEREQVEAI